MRCGCPSLRTFAEKTKFYSMEAKIFDKLKQEYAHLGLGDAFLQARAKALAGLGTVTDENIESVISSQKAFFEEIQKFNDKRVSEAVKKATDAAAAKAAEADKAAKGAQADLQRQIEALQQQLSERGKDDKSGNDDFQKKFAAANEETLAQMKTLQDAIKTLQESNEKHAQSVRQLQEEKAALEKQQAAAQRQAKIIAKAKELNIPQWRIDEGFSIGTEASEDEISTFLSKVSGNITNNILPTNSHFSLAGKEVSKNDADELAGKIVG